jgi:hypothetical protein
MEDDVAYKDWDLDSKKQLAADVAAAVLDAKVGNDDTTLRQVANRLKTWLGRQ